MKKKGFTLIELLAVIVILAVIAVIATPAVLNIIEDSKKSAAEASARSIVGSAETYYLKELMNNNKISNIDLSSDTLKYDGDKAEKGYVKLDKDGKGSGKMYISGYCVTVTSKSEITSEKVDSDDCEISSTYKVYADGEAVYYNPVTNTRCASGEAVSTTGTKEGCMKWYAFLDNENSSSVKLLLDHNTSNNVNFWLESDLDEIDKMIKNGEAPKPFEALRQLDKDTVNWSVNVKNTVRLLDSTDVLNIINYTGDTTKQIFFHKSSNELYEGPAGTNKFAWLFDNTYDCTKYGCNVEVNDMESYAYWLTGPAIGYANENFWHITWMGYIYSQHPGPVGIRPVITVDKNILK